MPPEIIRVCGGALFAFVAGVIGKFQAMLLATLLWAGCQPFAAKQPISDGLQLSTAGGRVCAASLVGPDRDLVLTAASCVSEASDAELQLSIGRQVTRLVVRARRSNRDWALLKLERQLPLAPAKLACRQGVARALERGDVRFKTPRFQHSGFVYSADGQTLEQHLLIAQQEALIGAGVFVELPAAKAQAGGDYLVGVVEVGQTVQRLDCDWLAAQMAELAAQR
ncbi:MAG: trypsin-like peptidase domain-containing protein [Deltaproteobacteria bacterium]|nr:trypsin-like peptidase domain-containing protein [Deltaproteobacteria bacterium]